MGGQVGLKQICCWCGGRQPQIPFGNDKQRARKTLHQGRSFRLFLCIGELLLRIEEAADTVERTGFAEDDQAFELMVPVGAAADDAQRQIDSGERRVDQRSLNSRHRGTR